MRHRPGAISVQSWDLLWKPRWTVRRLSAEPIPFRSRQFKIRLMRALGSNLTVQNFLRGLESAGLSGRVFRNQCPIRWPHRVM